MPWLRCLVVVAAVALTFLPPVNRLLALVLDRVRNPSQRTLEWAGIVVAVAATSYLIYTAFAQGRDLFPKTEDDCSYLIGARMMARGRLWMPQHELADFFESFYLFVKPVYCSIYFPGAALAFAPMVWFHWASWILPVVMSGAAVGLLFRIVTDMIDAVAGGLAAIWMVSLSWFRTLSIMVMSHIPMFLLALLMVWAWLRWRRQRRWGWALAVGAFAGWAAITRPADALCFAIPIGIAMAAELLGRPVRAWALCAGALLLGAAPFLTMQIVFDLRVTGRPFRSPYTEYLLKDQPGAEYGLRRYDPTLHPASSLPQKHAYYDWCRPFLRQHQPGNFLGAWLHGAENHPAYLLVLMDSTMPGRAMLVLATVGLLGLRDRRRMVLAATLPVFVIVYLFNPFFLEHYAILIAPAMMVLVLAGCRAAASAWPSQSRAIGAALSILVLALAVTSLWEVKRYMPTPGQPMQDGMLESVPLSQLEEGLPLAVQPPAVVLFRRGQADNFFEEPVYNTDVAWPDDAPIIRAHDLGVRNGEIIRYYAARQPDRVFYLFDVSTRTMIPLGKASNLAEALRRGKTLASLIPGT